MNTRRNAAAALVAIGAVALTGPPAVAAVTLDRFVQACGPINTGSGSITLRATLGQLVIGSPAAGVYVLGLGFWAGAGSAPVSAVPGDEAPVVPLPERSRLLATHPNPVTASTVIAFELSPPGPRAVSLQIFSATGRLVRTILQKSLDPGRYEVTWDGRDQSGALVPSGVYFNLLTGPNIRDAKKVEVVR